MDPADLRPLPLFGSLDRHELEAVARWTDDLDVPAGRALVEEGNFAYEFYVILEGEADVRRGDETINRLGPGDFFGELALLEADRRTASVVATTPLRVAVMLARDFKEMRREMPEVCSRITAALEERRGR